MSSFSALPLGVKWIKARVAEELPPRFSHLPVGADIGAFAFLKEKRSDYRV